MNNDKIKLITLKNNKETEVKITNYGGIIKEFNVNGRNIVLSKDNIEDYKDGSAYMGALIGRVANRIGEGTFELNGKSYHIPINNGPNTNHGGTEGFDSKIWNIEEVTDNKVVLTLSSPDGDQGFPGKLDIKATYLLNDNNELELDFEAQTDKPTPVNLTNHSYFNLNGKGDIKNHKLRVESDTITSSDENLLPTGEFENIKGTALDFTSPKFISEALEDEDNANIRKAKGVDHNFVLKNTFYEEMITPVRLEGDDLILEVSTNQPGIQIYTGNYLDEPGSNGAYYDNYSGIAIEAQNFPDAVNHPNFPNTILNPGEEYKAKIIYKIIKK